jgi:hypothetical protein
VSACPVTKQIIIKYARDLTFENLSLLAHQGDIKRVQSVTLWACLAQAGVTYVQTLDGIHIAEQLRH